MSYVLVYSFQGIPDDVRLYTHLRSARKREAELAKENGITERNPDPDAFTRFEWFESQMDHEVRIFSVHKED